METKFTKCISLLCVQADLALVHADAFGSINQGGSATGSDADVQSFGGAFASGNNPFGSFSAAGGGTAAVSVNDGKPSISGSIGDGFSDSAFGQSQSQTSSDSFSNGNPGTSSFQGINVGSNFGGVGTQSGSTSGTQSG